MNLENESLWVAEYNPKTKQFHIELAMKKVMRNVRSIRKDSLGEQTWMIVAIGTDEECDNAIDRLKNKL